MKTNHIICLIIACFTMVSGSWAQDTSLSGINIENMATLKQHDQVSVSFDISLDTLQVKRNNMLVLTPVLKSNRNNYDSITLRPVVVAGKKRYRVLQRKEELGEQLALASEPVVVAERKNKSEQLLHYLVMVPYSQWMRNASLSLVYEISGCADCISKAGMEVIANNILPAPYQPDYRLSYVMPEAEVKTRSDRHTATFNFVVDRWELLRDYKDNAPEFNEVDQIIGEIHNNPDFVITEFNIHGYASPEGSVSHNRILAENRANAFADYLASKFGIERNRFTVTGHGEDWEGLRNAISTSSLTDKQAILDIIDNISDPDARDAELMKLSGGKTYRTLLNNYYPPLRRTEYVVSYNVRPFDVEEAREIIKTNPRLLSLNEMFLVSMSYPAGSKEFKEVFDIAVRLYPDSEIAIINSASADIESGNIDGAIERMMKISNSPKVWNNLGVAYALKGDISRAKEYLAKAAAEGDNDARANLEEMRKAIENQ